MTACDHCAKPVPDGQRFCCDRHRAAWHRENVPHGTVTGIRALKSGGYSVTVRYQTLPPGLKIGCTAWTDNADSTRTDAASGDGTQQPNHRYQAAPETATSKE